MANVDTSSNTLLSRNEIPIIDLSFTDKISIATEQNTEEIAKQLNDALTTKGVAFLINHGIAEEKIKPLYKIMKTFCSLPENIRNQYTINHPETVQGYVPPGMERLSSEGDKKTEFRHSYNVLRLSEKLPSDEKYDFQDVIGNVVEDFYNLSIFLLKMIAKALEIEPEVLIDIHKGMLKEDNISTLRMLYYPPIGEDPSPTITRCAEHSDWGTFTLLTQDVEGGLEIFQEGQWWPVGHLPGAILINVADMLEVWTSSRYKSLLHRVVIPQDLKVRAKGRCSVAFFVHPDGKTLLDPSVLSRQPHTDLVDDYNTKGNIKKITAREYTQNKFSLIFEK